MLEKVFKFFNPQEIKRPNPKTLIIAYKKWPSALVLLSNFIFLGFWYKSLFRQASSLEEIKQIIASKTSSSPVMWIIFLVPVFLILGNLKHLKIVFRGHAFTFDGLRGMFLKGDSLIASFGEINRVQVKLPPFNSDVHRLSIILRNGKAVFISQGDDDTLKLAKEIAGIVNVEVAEKESSLFDFGST
jgi:hypothetical protein